MKILIALGRLCLNTLYYFLRLRPVKNRVCMLSRESNDVPADFLLLEKELLCIDGSLEIVYVCELLDTKHAGIIRIAANTLKCMNALSLSKACVADTYSLPVSILRHRRGLVIAQIWHALGAVKKFGYQCLDKEGGRSSSSADALSMHKNYTFVTCASTATKEIYADAFRIESEKVRVIGMPRLDYLICDSQEKELKKSLLYQRYPTLKDKINILYAPTFRENDGIKLDEILHYVDFERYNVIVKAHVLTQDKPDCSRVVFSDESVLDLFSVANYVITDYSSVSFEAAAAKKKLFFYLYDLDEYERERGLNINPLREYPLISCKDFQNIYAKIESKEYPENELVRFYSRFIETDDGKCCERIANALLNSR
ncbi:MAG: CDP-glycerol glycerophosphotransferase family protein [Acutalibacteraceae bacterium]